MDNLFTPVNTTYNITTNKTNIVLARNLYLFLYGADELVTLTYIEFCGIYFFSNKDKFDIKL